MTNSVPQFVSLIPMVLSPGRVSLHLKTTNFPGKSNVSLDFDLGDTAPQQNPTNQELEDPEAMLRNSPYPNVELSILDDKHNEVAQAIIVEHKEENISLTLHIRRPQPGKTYIARADMIHNQQLIQTLTVPFKLQPSDTEVES
ncbi:MAG: hypothetical protein GWN13_01660 [Phycisphaerae bacterium]|nr:hypothetical protein [Phycisphaerae bacterium]